MTPQMVPSSKGSPLCIRGEGPTRHGLGENKDTRSGLCCQCFLLTVWGNPEVMEFLACRAVVAGWESELLAVVESGLQWDRASDKES